MALYFSDAKLTEEGDVKVVANEWADPYANRGMFDQDPYANRGDIAPPLVQAEAPQRDSRGGYRYPDGGYWRAGDEGTRSRGSDDGWWKSLLAQGAKDTGGIVSNLLSDLFGRKQPPVVAVPVDRPPPAAPAGPPTWVYVAGGGALLLVLALVLRPQAPVVLRGYKRRRRRR